MIKFNSKIYGAYLSLLGYKKVPLRDTKGVLTPLNNFKYYKESFLHTRSRTILPSGTKITYTLDDMDLDYKPEIVKETVIIKKASGDKVKVVNELGKSERKIYKNNKLFSVYG